MENLDINFDRKIREIMRRALQGLVDSNDLTNTEKAHIKQFAEDDKKKFWLDINGLLIANPETTFEYWAEHHINYRDSVRLIEWLTKPIEQPITEQKPTSKTQKTTYQWQGNNINAELEILFNKMLGNHIEKSTTLEQFKAVFTAKPIDSINTKIEWLTAKNLLAYFIDSLEENKHIKKTINNDIWAIAKTCFTESDNISQLKNLYENNKSGKPKNHKIIDDLFD